MMSKLDELIQELCPDGVEYKTIEEIAVDIFRGSGIKRDEVTEDGIPCVRYGEIYTTYGIWFDSCVSHTKLSFVKSPKYFEYGDILFAITGESVEDIAKSTVYVGSEKCLAGGDIVVLKHNQDPKYLGYALATNVARTQKSAGKVKSKVVHSSVPDIKRIKLPVPPLEVQREIVRILDTFTLHQNELAAELAARKKQYEYYRDSLLTFDENDPSVQWLELGKVTNKIEKIKWNLLNVGEEKRYVDLSSIDRESHCIVETTTINKDNAPSRAQQLIKENDILFSTTRPMLKKYSRVGAMYENEVCSTGFCVLRAKFELILPSWIYHMITTDRFYSWVERYQKEGSYPAISDENVKKYAIPVPSMEEQQRIVEILDRFDALCNDISTGLPAEIEARQKQYEYYRDKLLTFKEKQA